MIAGRPTAASTSAVNVRLSTRGLILVRRDFSITTITPGKRFQGAPIFLLIEIRPIGWRDVPFRIRGLPDEEVAHTQFSRCADNEIGVRNACCIKIATHQRIGHFFRRDPIFHDILYGIDNLITPAVVERDIQDQATRLQLADWGYYITNVPLALLTVHAPKMTQLHTFL